MLFDLFKREVRDMMQQIACYIIATAFTQTATDTRILNMQTKINIIFTENNQFKCPKRPVMIEMKDGWSKITKIYRNLSLSSETKSEKSQSKAQAI